MEKKMLCFQDELTGALIGLVRATEGNEHLVTKETHLLVMEALSTSITKVNFHDETMKELIAKVRAEKKRLVPDCSECASPCGRTQDYDMELLWNAKEEVRSLKSIILIGIRGMAVYAYHAALLGYMNDIVTDFFNKALFTIGMDYDRDDLLQVVLEMGQVNLKCMELLNKANT